MNPNTFKLFATMVLLSGLMACKRADDVSPASKAPLWKIYKDSVTGTRVWTHTGEYWSYITPITHVTYADTSLPILLINDSTLSFMGYPLNYSDSLRGNYTLVDTANTVFYYNKSVTFPHEYEQLSLNRHNGIVTVSIYLGGLGGGGTHTYETSIR